MLGANDIKDYSTDLKDLQEASKEASSVESLDDSSTNNVSEGTHETDSIDNHRNDLSFDDETDNQTVIEYIPLKSRMTLTTSKSVESGTESTGTDSGAFTCSSLDGSFSSNSSLIRQTSAETKKSFVESDRDTEYVYFFIFSLAQTIILASVYHYNYYRSFRDRRAIARAHAFTRAKAFKSVINFTRKSNFRLHIFTT